MAFPNIITLSVCAAVLLLSHSVFAGSYYECSANSGCKLVVRPGMGWHMKLTDLEKNDKYLCTITTIAAVGHLNQTEAQNIGISDAQLSRGDYQTNHLTFSTYAMKVDNGYLYFDMENYGDIPEDASISCQKSQYVFS